VDVWRLSNSILLEYGPKPLNHSFKVADYNIHSESTLHANIRTESIVEKTASVKTQMEKLDKLYKDKIDGAVSLVTLAQIKTEINSDFAERRRELLSDQLCITKVRKKHNVSKERSIQTEMSSIAKERDLISAQIAKRDKEIEHYNEIIDQIKIEKQIILDKDVAFDKEYKAKNKELDAAKLEISKNVQEISEAKEELLELDLNKCVKMTDCLEVAVKKVESKFAGWTGKEVIEWIAFIEDGRFNQVQFIKAIKELQINGKTLKDLRNDSVLKWIGGGVLCEADDRRLLIANIDRVMNAAKDQKKKDNCTICVDGKINAVFLPCGHQVACFECYEKRKNEFRKCPICRVEITSVVKTFMNGF